MEHVIQSQQLITIRKPLDHAERGRRRATVPRICQRLARAADGVYQVEGEGWYAADGTTCAPGILMADGRDSTCGPKSSAQVARLDLRAKFIVEGFLSGLHASPFHGFSVEFSEHRKYVPGDDLKDLDWNVFAKTDRYYVKKFQAETNVTGYLVMDLSARWPTRTARS